MSVTLRPNVLGPKGYAGPCDGSAESLCALATTLSVDQFYPCDRRDTAERELCVTPSALIQSPSVISSCPGTSITLDATRSDGGGVRPLTFSWSASPRTCDNYYAVSSALLAAGSVDTITLGGAELNDGAHFQLYLVVVNFLGASSSSFELTLTRDALPLPSITIQAPPLLALPASASVSLEAHAQIAACFSPNSTRESGREIKFRWEHVASIGNISSEAPLLLDAASSLQRDLQLNSATMAAGVTYTLRATGCMGEDDSVCAAAVTQVMLRDAPLQVAIAGGDRTIGTSDSFVVDACASHDPDDTNVACNGNTRTCSSGISFGWRCAPVLANSTQTTRTDVLAGAIGTSACGVPPPNDSTCAWAVDGGTLAKGSYVLGARISNTGSGEAALAAVHYKVESGALPSASIRVLPGRKQNPTNKLRLFGRAQLLSSNSIGIAFAGNETISLLWTVSPADVNLAVASSTGNTNPILVVTSNQLQPGGTYSFTLRAVFGSKSALATSTVVMNRYAC